MGLLDGDSELTCDVYGEFVALLYEYRDIFAVKGAEITECNLMKCDLVLKKNAKL